MEGNRRLIQPPEPALARCFVVDITEEQARQVALNHLARRENLNPSNLQVAGVEEVAHMLVVTILDVGKVGGTTHTVRVNKHDGTIET